MRFVAIGLVALVSVSAGAARSTETDWKKVPYFDYPNQLYVTTDATWTNSDPVASSPGQRAAPPPTPFAERGLKRHFIWTKTCGPGAQFVSFSKTFMSPGDPFQAKVLLQYGPRLGLLPYNSAVLLLNSVEIARLGKTALARSVPPSFEAELVGGDLKAFRNGANTLTVRVARAALPRGQRCTGSGGYIGIVADVAARYGSGIRALPLQQRARTFVRIAAGSSGAYSGAYSFVNDGPSVALGGELRWNVGSVDPIVQLALLEPTKIGAPVRSCEQTQIVPLMAWEMVCTFVNWAPGVQVSGFLRGGYKVAAGFRPTSTTSIKGSFSVQRQDGPSIGRGPGSQDFEIVLCGPQATAPGCP